MARKGDAFYFDALVACADCACEAARFLEEVMRDYDPDALEGAIERMHALEQRADERRHELVDALWSAFITPFDREDLSLLGDGIDAVVDHIEGVLHRLYFDNVRSIRPDALETVGILVRGCDEMAALVRELPRYKRSQALREHVVAINSIEEEADRAFVRSMRALHTGASDPLEIVAWREVYQFLELVADACEEVADAVDVVVMKNS